MSDNMLAAALRYYERGWSIIPIHPETKKPAIKWREYQDRTPTEDEVIEWWERWPEADIGLVTGKLSGIVVVDCDTEDAQHAAFDLGWRSPVRVKTRRGLHLHYEHPGDREWRNRAGSTSSGHDWPQVSGLDFRGDGGYVVLPPSRGYSWDIPHGYDGDDLPTWQGWTPPEGHAPEEFDFRSLSLSHIPTMSPDDHLDVWTRTEKYVREHFPGSLKIPTGEGNGRNERVMRFISECIMDGYWGDELRLRGYAFMREFYEEQLPEPEYQATVASIESAERRNHPERFDRDGNYIPRPSGERATAPTAPATMPERLPVFHAKDADDVLEEVAKTTFLIEPWLPTATIVQVYGYSGHGKSLFVQHAMGALAAGRKYFGPFEIGRPGKVLYFDFEMGRATIARRVKELVDAHGDPGERLAVWAPSLTGREIDLNQNSGLLELQHYCEQERPDVVVIDTVRSGFPGLEENKADAWSKVNQVATRIRNAGAAVILVHHSNKPSEAGRGREAGSTNQLTVLETQIRVTQVFEDKETAEDNAAIWDESYDRPVWPQLRAKLPIGFRLYMVCEIKYGKVREWSDEHDRVQWIGYARSDEGEHRMVASSMSTKQKVKSLALDRHEPEEIASILNLPVSLVRAWLGLAA